jgi:hypothetical protein
MPLFIPPYREWISYDLNLSLFPSIKMEDLKTIKNKKYNT